MKLVAVNGSARAGGNTFILLRRVLSAVETAGVETVLVELAGKRVQGCTVCLRCRELTDGQCHGRKDAITELMPLIAAADALVIGSPVYFGDVTSETKALIDRVGYVARANPGMMTRKVGAGVVAQRRAGALHALDSINHLFGILGMIVPGSSYWNLGVGGAPGAVEEDAEGLATMDELGRNIAWLMSATAGSR